jgi:outer membrane lipoprotein-sorting protein
MVSFCAGLAEYRAKTMIRLLCRSLFLVVLVAGKTPAASYEKLDPWFKTQAGIQTWQADLIQTRNLKTLVHPLISTGRVWFARPNRFRWELGSPAQTIALRATNDMWVIYPRLERAERFALDAPGPWRDALGLLETGFPQNSDAMQLQFQLLSLTSTNQRLQAVLQPRTAAARKLIPRFTLELETNVWELLATEMQFADGSSLRNDFFNVRTNPTLESDLFLPRVPATYKVAEPLKGR